MLFEVPVIRRCCCWLPLRRGILVLAYLNLIITILLFTANLSIWSRFSNDITFDIGIYRVGFISTPMILVIILNALDIVFNILLIGGAHTKNSKLMRAYIYYQLTTMIANFFVVIISYIDMYHDSSFGILNAVPECTITFSVYVIQIYLLVMIYNELKKQRYQGGRSRFINHLAEVYLEPPFQQEYL